MDVRTRRAGWCLIGLAMCAAAVVRGQPAAPSPDGLIRDLQWRNIGNANQKGRISAIDALDNNWTHVVVATASGGVFKSINGGTSWNPIFDTYGAASIGAVRIFQQN